MARNHYTATFPAASPGAEVTWPNTVKVYPDPSTQVPLGNSYLDDSLSVSVYSDAVSVALTVGTETLTVTTGSPSATGAAPASPGGSLPDSRWAGYYTGAGPAAPQITFTDVDAWTEDSSAGTDITLGVDGMTFTLDGTGGKTYLVEGGAITTFTHGTTECLCTLNPAGAVSGDGLWYASTSAAAADAIAGPIQGTWVVIVPSGAATMTVRVFPLGGSADEAIANGGLTIVRIR